MRWCRAPASHSMSPLMRVSDPSRRDTTRATPSGSITTSHRMVSRPTDGHSQPLISAVASAGPALSRRGEPPRPSPVPSGPVNSGQDGMPPPEELISVRRTTRGRATVLTVEGDVDVATASVLRRAVDEALAEAGPHPLVIDLTGVTFLASRGLSTPVEAPREASASSPLRVVVDHTRPVIRPLQLSGLDRILTLFHDVEDALSGRPEVDVSE